MKVTAKWVAQQLSLPWLIANTVMLLTSPLVLDKPQWDWWMYTTPTLALFVVFVLVLVLCKHMERRA